MGCFVLLGLVVGFVGLFFLLPTLPINRSLAQTVQMKIKLLIPAKSTVTQIPTKTPAHESKQS